MKNNSKWGTWIEVGKRNEVSEKRGQEARKYTTREHIRIVELIHICRKGIPISSGVCDGNASRRGFMCVKL